MKFSKVSALFLGFVGMVGLTAGCADKPDGKAFRAALPRATDVQVKVPSTSARVTPGRANLVGETATFYTLTRGVSVTLNGGTAWVLLLVHTIAEFPVTSVDGDTLIWGPWDGDALQPSQYRLTASEDATGEWTWAIEAHKKSETSGAFDAVASGTTNGEGVGTIALDFDKAETYDPAGNSAEGQLSVAYDIVARKVTMDYSHDDTEPGGVPAVASFHYDYDAAADGAGVFSYDIHADLDNNGSAWEHATIDSSWLATGAGRSDFSITGGDVPTTVTGSECWDTSFLRVYFTATAGWAATEGTASACAL